MSRPDIHEYLMRVAEVAATRTTCIRRGVGCVLADAQGRILSVGYNGVPKGHNHCNLSLMRRDGGPSVYPFACEGHLLPAGQDKCEAVHAEQNAILQCRSVDAIRYAYVTLSPCKACVKLLANTPCETIFYREAHADLWPVRFWETTCRRAAVLLERVP